VHTGGQEPHAAKTDKKSAAKHVKAAPPARAQAWQSDLGGCSIGPEVTWHCLLMMMIILCIVIYQKQTAAVDYRMSLAARTCPHLQEHAHCAAAQISPDTQPLATPLRPLPPAWCAQGKNCTTVGHGPYKLY